MFNKLVINDFYGLLFSYTIPEWKEVKKKILNIFSLESVWK